VRLLLGRYLLICITPSTDLQAATYPAELFRGLRSSQWRAHTTADGAPFCSCWPLSLYGLLRQFQDLGRDDWLGRRFLFHPRLHYRTDRPRGEPAFLRILKTRSPGFPVDEPPTYAACSRGITYPASSGEWQCEHFCPGFTISRLAREITSACTV
jgi:hypothetical protein